MDRTKLLNLRDESLSGLDQSDLAASRAIGDGIVDCILLPILDLGCIAALGLIKLGEAAYDLVTGK